MEKKITIYHNPRCNKSCQTLQLIRDAGKEPEIVEYLKNPLTVAELEKILAKLNLKPQDVIRTSELEYKAHYEGKEFTDKEWIRILSENPKLIERPIVIKGNTGVIGRPPENVKSLLK